MTDVMDDRETSAVYVVHTPLLAQTSRDALSEELGHKLPSLDVAYCKPTDLDQNLYRAFNSSHLVHVGPDMNDTEKWGLSTKLHLQKAYLDLIGRLCRSTPFTLVVVQESTPDAADVNKLKVMVLPSDEDYLVSMQNAEMIAKVVKNIICSL